MGPSPQDVPLLPEALAFGAKNRVGTQVSVRSCLALALFWGHKKPAEAFLAARPPPLADNRPRHLSCVGSTWTSPAQGGWSPTGSLHRGRLSSTPLHLRMATHRWWHCECCPLGRCPASRSSLREWPGAGEASRASPRLPWRRFGKP